MNLAGTFDENVLSTLKERIDQVNRIQFNQKTMSNPNVVKEYDFAYRSLIDEILSLANTNYELKQQKIFRSLIETQATADIRVLGFRSDYDSIAVHFNNFIETYKTQLKEIDKKAENNKRPLFQMASDK